jgi:nucleoside-diphosphate-sugar epimerase
MSYLLMTGATGLLGEYLLRDLTLQGVKLCVVARGQRDASAKDRIEKIFSHWEGVLDLLLPRPVVFEGDITSTNFGLETSELAWIRDNCGSLLNNAASLTFESGRQDGEPWRSNLNGVLNAIGLCRETGLEVVHQVSTAYVAGLRTGQILESELDVGQSFANEYEASKCAAELAMREAGFRSLTVFRPAIIVGDSETGYTSTFHGFYAPLKAMHALLNLQKPTGTSGAAGEKVPVKAMLQALGLVGNETKNFVPVEWVSRCMANVIADKEHHDKVYHLTPKTRVTSMQAAVAIQASLEKHVYSASENINSPSVQKAIPNSGWESLGESFATQVSVYKEYWRDDAEFSSQNIDSAMPNDPCPNLTSETLQKMCDFAIRSGFGWPKPKLVKLDVTIESWLTGKGIVPVSPGSNFEPKFNLSAIGPGGGDVVFGRSGEEILFRPGHDSRVGGWLLRFECLKDASLENLVKSGEAILLPTGTFSEEASFGAYVSKLTNMVAKLDHTGPTNHTLGPRVSSGTR